MPTTRYRKPSLRAFACALLLLSSQVPAAVTDIASSPLQTSTTSLVKPNIFFILDNSGSMFWDYMPDWVTDSASDPLGRNAGYNGIYYDPSVTYTPPLNYDGTSYSSMTAANSSNWTRVPFDGYGIQSPSDGSSLLVSSNAGSTQNLVGNAYYYTFIPGEYCTSANLKTCNLQSAPDATYTVPAGLRWCTNAQQTNCQASRIDTAPSGGSTYLFARYPGSTPYALITVGGSGSTSVTSIKVNGQEILSGSTSASGTVNTVGSRIASNINSCTSGRSGNCTIAGYSATNSSGTLLVYAPSSVGAITYTPVITKTGNMTVTPTAFSGGIGSNPVTNIVSTTATYTYPGSTERATTRTDCAGNTSPKTCTYAEEMTNYSNWWAYYHTRMQMAKTSATLAFSVLDNNYRLGYMTINSNGNYDFLNIADNSTGTGGQKSSWYSYLVHANPSGGTGLRTALSLAGRYYAGKLKNTSVNGTTANDPMQYACQRNYTMLTTDGYWNDSTTPKQIDGVTNIGDQDSSENRPQLDGNSASNTLADVAEYYYSTDIRSSSFSNATGSLSTDVASNNVADQQQRMYTYTVGLGASGYMQYQSNYATATSGDFFDVARGTTTSSSTQSSGVCIWQTSGSCNWPTPVSNQQTTSDDLWHAAVNGRGTYYSATNPSELKSGLTGFLQRVAAATSNAAAATTSNPNVSSGDNFIFKSTFRSVQWYGELSRTTINPTTGVVSSNSDWSESGTVPSNATATPPTYTTPLLDNLDYASRNIYTYDPTNTSGTLINFAWPSLTTTMKSYFQITGGAISSLSQLCSSGTNCLPSSAQVDSTTAGTNTGAGGINLVNFLRGDRSNEGPDGNTYYFQRTHVLGDIVDSQAVYVKAPKFNYADSGYTTYVSSRSSRQGTVYVGANDGMLHAFNADTGAESWAYIPSVLLPNLYKLADKNYSSNHAFYVDATPQDGDVYYDSAWHTILVGGFGAGGRGFYALDVTDPASPSVLWEFTSDTTKSSPYIRDADMGYSFGRPIITKLTDGTWVVIVSSGYNNVSPGGGHGIVWILNAKTGAVIKKIDTGAGSSSAAVTGCSTAPCPAGLAKLAAYAESSAVNNMAPRLYGGDLLGNLWRIDISAITGSGTGSAVVQLLATLSDASTNRQPMTAKPELGKIGSTPIVYVGTGSYLGLSDVSTTGVQSIYAIKDTLATTSTPATVALYSNPRSNTCGGASNCFVRQTYTDTSGVRTSTTNAVNFANVYGWFVDLPESGERASTDPDLQLGTLAFTTNIPSTSSACSIGGSSYLNFVDYRTGSAVTGATSVGTLLSNGTSTALASAPTLVRLSNGKVVAITSLSDGTTITSSTPISGTNGGTRRVSWRELVTGQ